MKKLMISCIAFGTIFSSASAQNTETVFKKFYDATGGKSLWDGVTTYTIKQAYRNNSSSDFDMAIISSLTDQSMSKTKTILKRDFIYGIAGTDGWLKIPLGSTDKGIKYDTQNLSDKEKETMRRELVDLLVPFLNYDKKSYIVSFVAAENENGKTLQHIEVSGKNIKYDLYFDNETGLLTRKKQTLASGEIITEEFTKYTPSAYGINYPSEGTMISSLDKKNFKVTTSMSFNEKLDISAFKR